MKRQRLDGHLNDGDGYIPYVEKLYRYPIKWILIIHNNCFFQFEKYKNENTWQCIWALHTLNWIEFCLFHICYLSRKRKLSFALKIWFLNFCDFWISNQLCFKYTANKKFFFGSFRMWYPVHQFYWLGGCLAFISNW